MKYKTHLILGICIAIIVSLPISIQAADKKKSAPAESASPAASAAASGEKPNPRPGTFHGMATAVDQKGQAFTIAGKEKSRVFKVTANTKITKAGNDATMSDIVDNTEISGSYWKRDDGTLEAKTLRLGPVRKKKEKASASESPAPTP